MADTRNLSSYAEFVSSTTDLLLNLPLIQGTYIDGTTLFIGVDLNSAYASGNYPFLVNTNSSGYYYLNYWLDQTKGSNLMVVKALQEVVPSIRYTKDTLITYSNSSDLTVNSVDVYWEKNSSGFNINGSVNISIGALTSGTFDLDFGEVLSSNYSFSIPQDTTLLGTFKSISSLSGGLLRISISNTSSSSQNNKDILIWGIVNK